MVFLISDSKFISTGAPQGCVSTPLYTNSCVSKTTHNYIVKFSDDMTILSLLCKDQDISPYSEIEQFLERCDLTVNVKKSEEIIFDPMSVRSQSRIYSQCSQVSSYKYLVFYIDCSLTWHVHAESLCFRLQQRVWC